MITKKELSAILALLDEDAKIYIKTKGSGAQNIESIHFNAKRQVILYFADENNTDSHRTDLLFRE